MPSDYDHEKRTALSAEWIPRLCAGVGAAAYLVALAASLLTQDKQIGVEGRWTVSRVIGGEYPERPLFQILSAIAMGPRAALIGVWFLLLRGTQWPYASEISCAGVLRFVTGILLAFIPIGDDHDTHDLARVLYGAFSCVWMVGLTKWSRDTDSSAAAYRQRRNCLCGYTAAFMLLVHYFSEHRLYNTPGAFGRYCVLEWLLVFIDAAFDGLAVAEFGGIALQVAKEEVSYMPSKGKLAFV